MEQFILVHGAGMAPDGRGVNQPVTQAGQMVYSRFVTPNMTGFTNLVVYHYNMPPCWRQAWVSEEINGDPIPGNVMINPSTGQPFVPGAINGVSAGMDPVAVQVWVGDNSPPKQPGWFYVPPVCLKPDTPYWFNFINRYGGPGGLWPTTGAYTKFYPISG